MNLTRSIDIDCEIFLSQLFLWIYILGKNRLNVVIRLFRVLGLLMCKPVYEQTRPVTVYQGTRDSPTLWDVKTAFCCQPFGHLSRHFATPIFIEELY